MTGVQTCALPISLGPLHAILGVNADPALNNLHRGQVALRERTAEYNAHIQGLQHQPQISGEDL